MKRLEDQLKETFDHFEPEVDATVWNKVNAQLKSTASVHDGGSSIGSTTITKGILAKLGPIAGYVAGTAALISMAVVLWKFTTKNQEKQNTTHPSIISKTEQPIPENSINTTNSKDAVEEPLNKTGSFTEKNSISTTNTNSTTRKHTLSEEGPISITAIANPNLTSTSTETNLSKASEAKEIQTNKQNSQTSTSVKVNDSKEHSIKTDPEDNNSKTIVSNSENQTPPVLMVNTRGGFAPLTITAFTNQNGKTADFNFGEGSISNGVQSASHKYENPGVYTIHCKVGEKELETTIEVIGQLSTVFSPNSDGINDLFIAASPDAEIIEMQIFDRTGKQLFRSKGSQVNWDGKMADGRLAETGTYFYNIFVTSVSGITYKQKGIISLFR